MFFAFVMRRRYRRTTSTWWKIKKLKSRYGGESAVLFDDGDHDINHDDDLQNKYK